MYCAITNRDWALSPSTTSFVSCDISSASRTDSEGRFAMYSAGDGAVETSEALQELSITTPNPFLAHTLRQEHSSVLSLAADTRYIFSGSQGRDIYVSTNRTRMLICSLNVMKVWDRQTFQIKTTLKGHEGSVLMLTVSEEKGWLFSASSKYITAILSVDALHVMCILLLRR